MDQLYQPSRRSWVAKFAGALRGCVLGTRGHSSFLIHLPVAVAVLGLAIYFQVAIWEWCILIGCITAVITSELLNSAVETLSKAVTRQHDGHVAAALDIASGAVLFAAIGAASAGLVILGPRLWMLVF